MRTGGGAPVATPARRPDWMLAGMLVGLMLGGTLVNPGRKLSVNVRVFRAEHNWSQAELAARLRVSRQTINAIETGKYDPSLPLAFQIARCFNMPIEAIFFPDEVPDQETP